MTAVKHFEKTPDEVLDFTRRWNKWLNGDAIDTSTWETDEGNVTIDSNSIDGTKTIVWLSGGGVGQCDRITNKIITTAGRTAERTFVIKIVEFRAE